MAQFDTNVPLVTGTVNVPQPHAVEDHSTASFIGQLGQVGLQAADDVQKSAAAGSKAIGQANLADYSIQLGKLQQAVEQGTMSSATARTRVRALRNGVIANNPSLLPQIDSTTTSFLSDSGLGANIVKGSPAEQQQADIVNQMTKDGWNITPNMDQGQQQDLIHAWQQQKLAQQQLQQTAAQVALTNAKLETTSKTLGIESQKQNLVTGAITQQSSQLALEQKLHQTAANQAIFNGANAWNTNFTSKINGIISQFNNSGKTPADMQAATDQVNLELAQITGAASKAGIGGDQNVIDQALAPMKALATSATQFIAGKIQTQGLQDATTNASNMAKLLAIHSADEKSRKILGISMLAPGMSSALQTSLVDSSVLQMLGENSQDPSGASTTGQPVRGADTAVGRGDANYGSVDSYLNGIKVTVDKANLGTLDHNSEVMLRNNITNIANGLLNGNTKAKNPQDYNRIVQFLADPSINSYIVAHPEVMRTGNLKGVSDMLAHEYTLNIKPLVEQQWSQGTVQGGRVDRADMPTMSTPYGPVPVPLNKESPREAQITPSFTGGGIIFTANDPKNSQAVAVADSLNQKVAPVMGRLIRATATLEGTNNYRKVWNETYSSWFGLKPDPSSDTADAQASQAQPTGAQGYTVDNLMDALIHQESRGNNDAVSSKGAISQVQMLPSTATALGYSPEDLKDPATAREAGKEYLGMMLSRFGGNVRLALAAYNAGPGTVSKLVKKYGDNYAAIESYLPAETRDYVPKVVDNLTGG